MRNLGADENNVNKADDSDFEYGGILDDFNDFDNFASGMRKSRPPRQKNRSGKPAGISNDLPELESVWETKEEAFNGVKNTEAGGRKSSRDTAEAASEPESAENSGSIPYARDLIRKLREREARISQSRASVNYNNNAAAESSLSHKSISEADGEADSFHDNENIRKDGDLHNRDIKDTSTDMAKNKRKTNAVTTVIIVIAAVVMVVALYNLIAIGTDYAEDANLYEALRSYAQIDTGGKAEGELTPRLALDFTALRIINPDIRGWIYIPETSMSYPVVQGSDNEYYLTHGFDKEERKSGAVFMDVAANPNFTDTNTILYGHNMKDGSMFAMLHNYEKQAYYDLHPTVYIYLPDDTVKEYRIFSAYETEDDSPAYLAGVWEKRTFDKYVSDALKNSQIDCGVYPSFGDDLILLSTCVTGSDNTRYVVHAAEIN